MSLFKICNWWTTQCEDVNESYDSQLLVICRFGLIDNEKDYVVIGTYNGNLSIYYPNFGSTESKNGFKPTDLLLETKLKDSIINICAGKFSGNSGKSDNINQLAVLHSKSITIYNLKLMNGLTEQGSHCILQSLMEHKFDKTANYMCKGPFGGIKGREFLCIGHSDGTLTFFEQEGITYQCQLSGAKSMPFSLSYIQRTDSFIRINICWELECFSYQDMSQSHISQGIVNSVWSVCVGEFVLDVCPIQVTSNRTLIMILGEHNLFSIFDDGRFNFMIKLDFAPKCFHSFLLGWYFEPKSRLITAVVSESGTLLVYEELKLIWAAQLEDSPITIRRSNLNNLPGGLVTLNSSGLLKIGYLGSDPSIFKIPTLNLNEISFEQAHKELLKLESDIKSGIDVTDLKIINSTAANDLEIDFKIFPILEKCLDDDEISMELKNKFDNLQMSKGVIKLKSNINLEHLQITFLLANGLTCSPPIISINNLTENLTEIFELNFYVIEDLPISSIKVEACISFISKQGIPRVLSKEQILPIALFYKPCIAQKDATIKVTVSVKEKNTIKISKIFSKICNDEDIQHLGLCSVFTGQIVTVVAAKSSNRFRIQSDSLDAILPVLEVIINYVKNLNKDNDVKNSEKEENKNSKRLRKSNKIILITPPLPNSEVITRITEHNAIQEIIRKQTALMDNQWNQFKLFQRSLQSKAPETNIDGLMMLIEKNYDDLVTEGDKLVEMRITERKKRASLSCAISLLNIMISYMNLEEKLIELVTSSLSYPIEDWTEKSWEEVVDPSLNMLHNHKKFSKSGKAKKLISSDANDGMTVSNNIPYEFDRFKKHFLILLERIYRLVSESSRKPSSTKLDEESMENFREEICEKIIDEDLNDNDPGENLEKKIENDWSSSVPAAELLLLKINNDN